jgi:hypothetical protein
VSTFLEFLYAADDEVKLAQSLQYLDGKISLVHIAICAWRRAAINDPSQVFDE